MGQYHLVVNLDKKEYLDPHKLGSGLKLWEQMANHPGTATALIPLLAVSNGRGGGDIHNDPDNIVGRWGGDRIAIVGDYGDDDDLPAEFEASKIYNKCDEGEYTDISDMVAVLIERELEGKYTGSGWRRFKGAFGG